MAEEDLTVEDEATSDDTDLTEDEVLEALIAEDEAAEAAAAEDEILGATPAEEAPPAPEPAPVTDVREEIEALRAQGYSLSQLTVTTNAHGTPIAVEVA